MADNKRVAIGLVILGVLVFAITYCIRSAQLDDYAESLGNAVYDTEEDESVDISAIKVGYEGKTYTLDEFVDLEEIPVVVDILIAQSDGMMANKPAYVSYALDDTDSITYVDGAYGRLILPAKYNKGGNADVG